MGEGHEYITSMMSDIMTCDNINQSKEDYFMKTEKLVLYALCVAVLAFFVDLITNVIQSTGFVTADASLTFVTFIVWASYFLFGATPKGAVSGFLGIFAGAIAAILIFVLVGVYAGTGMNVGLLAIPLAVFTLVIFMLCLEKAPYFNNVAAVFLGTGIYFGLMGTPAIAEAGYGIVMVGELVYAAIGLTAGWLTILIRTAVDKPDKKTA
jgi:hypothetical protein